MRKLFVLALGLWSPALVAAALNESTRPLSLPPSGYWEGNDGQWSTFILQIGTPPQVVRLIPGTSATAANVIWTVIPEGCEQANPDLNQQDCAVERGGLFTRNASTTWTTSRLENGGLYEIVLYEENMLGLSANAYYGFDTISFGLPGSGLPTLNSQVIAGIATNDFFLGTLALSPISQNFTSYTTGAIPSVLGTLRNPNNSLVPSTTWGYTSGAVYKSPPVFGSVTFGGYDANRIDLSDSKSVSVPFWTDPSRDLLLGLQSITYDTLGSTPLLVNGVYAFIDSLVAQMWLPLDVCQAFERAFGLQWDNVTELYVVNDTTHSTLLSQNPAFTFTVGPSKDQGSKNTIINIPYSAFDLNVSTPYYNQSQRYFPLKRAQNVTQYTLGRAFLQEAYVIADYDRRNFTIGQALFPSTENTISILPPGVSVSRKSSGLSKGAIAGIAVGAIVVLAAVATFVWWWLTRRKRSGKQQYVPALTDEKPPLDKPDTSFEPDQKGAAKYSQIGELRGDTQYRETPELSASRYRSELAASEGNTYELPSHDRYELAGGGIAANELESSRQNQAGVSVVNFRTMSTKSASQNSHNTLWQIAQ